MDESKIFFSNHTNIIEYQNKVVIYNRNNGQWIRVSKEVYDILNYAVNNELNINNLLSCIEDEEDKVFMRGVYSKLLNKKLINNIYKNKDIKTVGFELTNRCNLKCVHCCMDADINNKVELSTDQVKIILNKIISWNPKEIMLSGGEPMIRKDFVDILVYLRENYTGRITLSTNATLIDDQNIKIITENVDNLEISLDGVDEETCSKVRGRGVFKKVISNIKKLKKLKYDNIKVSMVFGDRNEKLRKQFIKLNKKLGTKPVLRRFSPIGRGANNQQIFLENNKEQFYIPKEYLSSDYKKELDICTCNGGNSSILIRYNGDIYPCASFINENMFLGNILENSTYNNLCDKKYDLLENSVYKKFSFCKTCKVNLFCWTCPGTLVDVKSEKSFKDMCNKIKPVLYKRVWGDAYVSNNLDN